MIAKDPPTYRPDSQSGIRDGGKFLTSVLTINRRSHGRVPARLPSVFRVLAWRIDVLHTAERTKKTSSRCAVVSSTGAQRDIELVQGSWSTRIPVHASLSRVP